MASPDGDERETDPVFFMVLNRRFNFSIDVAASPTNYKCEPFWTRETDGLRQTWAGKRVWCNPPFSAIEPWVYKAHQEAQHTPLIVMLLPSNRTEQRWWQRWVEPYRDRGLGFRVEFLPGRPRFLRPGQDVIGPNERPRSGCCLLIWER